MRAVAPVSLVLFVAACCMPALDWRKDGVMYGYSVLAVGWSGIFAGVLAWYANPLLAFAMGFSFMKQPKTAAVFGLLSLGLALTTYLWIGRELPGDEGGVTKTAILKLLPGCYVWFASIAVIPLAALLPLEPSR